MQEWTTLLVFTLASCFISFTSAQGQVRASRAAATRFEASPLLAFSERRLVLHASIAGWEVGPVSGVAAGSDAQIYVMQRGPKADPICVFDANGSLLRSWGKGDFVLPHSLRLDSTGNVWALDAGASKVIKYSPTGDKLLTIDVAPVPDTGSPFRGVTDIAFASNSDVYVTDGYENAQVIEFNAHGKEVFAWGHPGAGDGEFHLPHAIQVSPTGTVYIADRENGRIQAFDLHGNFLGTFPDLERCYSLVLDGGVLWASISPLADDPGAPGWILKIDAATGRLLGHIDVLEARQGHELARLVSGDLVVTAGNGLLVFSLRGALSCRRCSSP